MTLGQIHAEAQRLAAIARLVLPPDANFVIVLAAKAEDGAEVTVRTATMTTVFGDQLRMLLAQVQHGVDAMADQMGPGRTVDATPKPGPSS